MFTYLVKCDHFRFIYRTQRGVSGGEKRRVSIAAGLLNDADIIFLDEPTSGLDAYTAARTIKTLKQFCLISNKTVIATIHQPSAEVFRLFDQLVLLGAGRSCFAAPIHIVDEFFADKISPNQNPADVIIYEAQQHPDDCAERWSNHQKRNSHLDIDAIRGTSNQIALSNHNDRASWCIQFWLLLRRELRALYRGRIRDSVIRVLAMLILAFLMGFAYRDMSPRIQSRVEFMFLTAFMVLLYSLISTVIVLPAQKLLFRRETRSGNYGVSSWALSCQIIEFPREAILMALYTKITVSMSGAGGALWNYFLVFLMTDFVGGSLSLCCGVMVKDLMEAVLVVPGLCNCAVDGNVMSHFVTSQQLDWKSWHLNS